VTTVVWIGLVFGFFWARRADRRRGMLRSTKLLELVERAEMRDRHLAAGCSMLDRCSVHDPPAGGTAAQAPA
jgi:hypothetical protein